MVNIFITQSSVILNGLFLYITQYYQDYVKKVKSSKDCELNHMALATA